MRAPHELRTQAFELGSEAGADRASFAGDCPFDATRLDERRDWMRGFGQARSSLPSSAASDHDAARKSDLPPMHEG